MPGGEAQEEGASPTKRCQDITDLTNEGTLPPVDKHSEVYKAELKSAQAEVGSLQWIAQKPRPN
eukprot:11526307-Prorocentrum_lima.AAC.1